LKNKPFLKEKTEKSEILFQIYQKRYSENSKHFSKNTFPLNKQTFCELKIMSQDIKIYIFFRRKYINNNGIFHVSINSILFNFSPKNTVKLVTLVLSQFLGLPLRKKKYFLPRQA